MDVIAVTMPQGARIVLLGTAGGASTYPETRGAEPNTRFGVSSVLVVDGHVYVIDAGQGAARQLTLARLGGTMPGQPSEAQALVTLRAIFLTHLHSDHTMDLVNLLLCGYSQGWPIQPVDLYGPGPRGMLPRTEEAGLPVVNQECPTPGVGGLFKGLIAAFATDLNDRVRVGGKSPLNGRVRVHDLLPPPGTVVNPNIDPSPSCSPWLVMTDERVQVSATLVRHGAMYPALAYRFETAYGSVVFSGDTSPSANLVRLARGADILVHEVIDSDWALYQYGPGPLTYEQEQFGAHVVAKHTTAEKVGSIAEEAGVRTLVLNHFTPGNAPRERWLRAKAGFSGRLIIGEDLLQIPVTISEKDR